MQWCRFLKLQKPGICTSVPPACGQSELFPVFVVCRQDNHPCDIMEQSHTVTICCVSQAARQRRDPSRRFRLRPIHTPSALLVSVPPPLPLQNSGPGRCDRNANTSELDRNRLSPCQPNSGPHNPHLQLFPDNQWEGRDPAAFFFLISLSFIHSSLLDFALCSVSVASGVFQNTLFLRHRVCQTLCVPPSTCSASPPVRVGVTTLQ